VPAFRLALVLLAIGLTYASPSSGMDFSLLSPGDPKVVVSAVGEILPGDNDKLRRFVQALPANASFTGILLQSPGGNLSEGVRLASTIRDRRITTGVANMCASACFLMFAAGANKVVFDNARVGVHSASMHGVETVTSQAVTTLMARMAAELNVPPAIIGRMVTTPPDQMAWLSREELTLMGVRFATTTDQPSSPPAPVLHPSVGSQPAPTPPNPPSFAPPEINSAFVDGLTARVQFEEWLRVLQGDYRQGAEWWTAHRDTSPPGSCVSRSNGSDWSAGCQRAQALLTPSDQRSRSEPDFRDGWNSL
jgi:hypothetical protein